MQKTITSSTAFSYTYLSVEKKLDTAQEELENLMKKIYNIDISDLLKIQTVIDIRELKTLSSCKLASIELSNIAFELVKNANYRSSMYEQLDNINNYLIITTNSVYSQLAIDLINFANNAKTLVYV